MIEIAAKIQASGQNFWGASDCVTGLNKIVSCDSPHEDAPMSQPNSPKKRDQNRAYEQSIGRKNASGPEIGLLVGKNVTKFSALYVANAVDRP